MAQLQHPATSRRHDGADAGAHGGSAPAGADAGGSKARRVTFRVLGVLTALWVLAMSIFALLEIVLMWLPGDTLLSMIDDLTPADLAHRSHFMNAGVIAWALVLGVFVQLRGPARREAPMLHALAIALGASVLFALSGSLGDWLLEEATLLVPLLALGFLHPRASQLIRMPTWDRDMAALAAVAAVPWLTFAFTQAQLQWRNAAGDAHAEAEHWAAAALMALVVVACALIGSTAHSGWRLTAWIAALASVNYGLHSLAFAEQASAASAPWAVAATLWGVVYAAAVIRRSRRPDPGRGPAGRRRRGRRGAVRDDVRWRPR